MSSTIQEYLENAASQPAGSEVELTVRELLEKWGAQRRGASIVADINHALHAYDLVTEPNFEYEWIDSPVKLVRTGAGEAATNSDSDATTDPTSGTLKIGHLSAAKREPISCLSPGDTVERAHALMLKHDFSQLPVIDENRRLLGAISWESIAKRLIHKKSADLLDCMVEMHQVDLERDFLPLIPDIISRGYIGVTNTDHTLSGIVTTADISEEFLEMAEPFLLIGECERNLRRVVGRHFSEKEIKGAGHNRGKNRPVNEVSDLSFGELHHIFDDENRWKDIGWRIDRAIFLECLDSARKTRNVIMHFSTDPVPEGSLAQLRNTVRWLKVLGED